MRHSRETLHVQPSRLGSDYPLLLFPRSRTFFGKRNRQLRLSSFLPALNQGNRSHYCRKEELEFRFCRYRGLLFCLACLQFEPTLLRVIGSLWSFPEHRLGSIETYRISSALPFLLSIGLCV